MARAQIADEHSARYVPSGKKKTSSRFCALNPNMNSGTRTGGSPAKRRRLERMEAAPRSWQLSLYNWSVTRKVGIVLVLPVLLATVFAVLRINTELRTMSQLDAATEQSSIIRPIVKFNTAAEQLAVITTASWGNTADPQTDTALGKFDQSVADLQTAMHNTRLLSKTTEELSAAIATATAMRNNLRTGSVAALGQQADEIAGHTGNAIAYAPNIDDINVQRYFLQLGAIQTARRSMTQVRLLITAPGAGNNPSVRPRVLTTTGAEMTIIGTYAMIKPENAVFAQPLMEAVQARLGIFSQNVGDPTSNPAVLDSLQASSDTYDKTSAQLADQIDKSLANATSTSQNDALREAALVIGMLLAGLALALAVARTLVVPVRRLRRDALEVAHTKLPEELSVVRAGGTTPQIEPVAVRGTDEIGQLARAVDEMHEQALNLAAEQARLRLQIGNMFETLSRRSQSLVEQQLALIEDLEHDEDDTERLQSLFRLDHLATRMRRNGDNLLVLAGTALRRGQLLPVPLSDMLWSAVSQVEDYQRVEIGAVPDGVVAGEPAVDIEHLLAELIDNALRYSPPTTPVAVTVARAVDGGYLIEVTDRGLGMAEDDLRTTNDRLASGGEVTIETARRMGLFVVGRLAKRHNITVGLRRTSTMSQQPGITASVHLPGTLVAPPLDDTDPTGIVPPLSAESARPAPPQLSAAAAQQPRTLVPVPNLPQSGQHDSGAQQREAGLFGLTSAGLPQRKPAIRVAETPEQPAISAPTGSGQFPTGPFGPPTQFTEPVSGSQPIPLVPQSLSGPQSMFDDADPAPTDIWAEIKDDDELPTGRVYREPPTAYRPERSGPIELPTISENRTPEPDSPRHGPDPQRRRLDPAEDTAAPAQEPAATSTRLQPVAGSSPTPIYQRMVSEWLVEPAATQAPADGWTSPADAGWLAAEDASHPTATGRTAGGLPIRKPGAQLVPGGVTQVDEQGIRDPEEIRSNLTRHLSGVRSGRANAQYNDGGLA
ncbi:HAMP domain-containing protein [Nocardia arthritidis]|uniref:histidine kinase n=2 Tax=Nocardia arthritidis TaxID=228602 RepID=A0A6G9YRP3_9NOCA|nr:HAMP domain-containing protein [Nocardia arthritidis]